MFCILHVRVKARNSRVCCNTSLVCGMRLTVCTSINVLHARVYVCYMTAIQSAKHLSDSCETSNLMGGLEGDKDLGGRIIKHPLL